MDPVDLVLPLQVFREATVGRGRKPVPGWVRAELLPLVLRRRLGPGMPLPGPDAAEEQLEQLVSLVVSLAPGAGAAAGSCSPCS